MDISIKLLRGRIVASRARSFLAYQDDSVAPTSHAAHMSLHRNKLLRSVLSRHSLRGSLRFIPRIQFSGDI